MSEEFIEDLSHEERFEPIRDKGFLIEDGHYAYNYEIYDCMWDDGQVGANLNLFNGRNYIHLDEKNTKGLIKVLEYYLSKIEDCKVIITEATKKEDG